MDQMTHHFLTLLIQANKFKTMKDMSFKKLTTSHRRIFPDWRLFHLGRWMTPDRDYLGCTGHWDTRGTPDSPARGLHSSLPVSENHNWTQSPRRRKYLINNRNNSYIIFDAPRFIKFQSWKRLYKHKSAVCVSASKITIHPSSFILYFATFQTVENQ